MKDFFSALLLTVRSPKQGVGHPIMRQFMKFGVVGVLNTLSSLLMYSLLIEFANIEPIGANAAAFVVSVTMSFFLNKRWTFRNRSEQATRQYAAFFVISGIGLLISSSIIFLTHNILGWQEYVAFFTAVVIVLFWNFNANRMWTFKLN